MPHIWPLPRIEFTAFDEIAESRPVILVHTGELDELRPDLPGLRIIREIAVPSADMPLWMELAAGLIKTARTAEDAAIYAVGDGLAMDAGKYFALQAHLPLACLPTALDTDAFLTPTSAVRHGDLARFIETKPAGRAVIDFDLLAAAPPDRRAAGLAGLLSIATALWDWEFAEEEGRNPEGMELVPWAADAAQAILQGGLDCAEAAGAGDQGGLKQLLDCQALAVQLCSQLGHTRPLEGSEHYFAYAAGFAGPAALPPAALLAAGVLAIAEQQEQDTAELRAAFESGQVPVNALPAGRSREILRRLPGFVRKHDLPFGIAHEMED